MLDQIILIVIAAVVSGSATGLITWGAMRVEMRWLRRDVDRHQMIFDSLPCLNGGRRAYDPPHPCNREMP